MIEFVMDHEKGQARIIFEDGATKILPVPKSVTYHESGSELGTIFIELPMRHVKLTVIPRPDARLETTEKWIPQE